MLKPLCVLQGLAPVCPLTLTGANILKEIGRHKNTYTFREPFALPGRLYSVEQIERELISDAIAKTYTPRTKPFGCRGPDPRRAG